MAYIFDTESGSSYAVENGRITRESWNDHNENVVENFDRRLCRPVRPVRIGERAVLKFRDARPGEDEYLTTSRVTHVQTIRRRNASDPVSPGQWANIEKMWANLR